MDYNKYKNTEQNWENANYLIQKIKKIKSGGTVNVHILSVCVCIIHTTFLALKISEKTPFKCQNIVHVSCQDLDIH